MVTFVGWKQLDSLQARKHNRAKPLCSATFEHFVQTPTTRAQRGQQGHHFLRVDGRAGPLKFCLNASQASQQESSQVEAHLQHRKRCLAEMLTLLVTLLRSGVLHAFALPSASRFVNVTCYAARRGRIHFLATLRHHRTVAAVVAFIDDRQDRTARVLLCLGATTIQRATFRTVIAIVFFVVHKRLFVEYLR